jgi:hypothetical protein
MKWIWNNKELGNMLDFLQKLVFAIGIPISIFTFVISYQKEKDDFEYFIYDNLDKKTWEYASLSMKYAHLGLSDAVVGDGSIAVKPDSLFTDEEKIIAMNLMYLVISMYERAHLMYSKGETNFRQRQWIGWDLGMKRWISNKQFRKAWLVRGEDFDAGFQFYVNELIKQRPL